HHSPDRHREEERHHDGRLRTRRRTQAWPDARTGDPGGLPRALPADLDDDARRVPRRDPACAGERAGLGAAPAARHHHRRRPSRIAAADALYDAGDLSPARPAPPQAPGQTPCTARAGLAVQEVEAGVLVLKRGDFSSNRHPALASYLRMIFSENRCTLFGIML